MSDAKRIERLERVLGTLISWMGQSSGCPLSRVEIENLLTDLFGEELDD